MSFLNPFNWFRRRDSPEDLGPEEDVEEDLISPIDEDFWTPEAEHWPRQPGSDASSDTIGRRPGDIVHSPTGDRPERVIRPIASPIPSFTEGEEFADGLEERDLTRRLVARRNNLELYTAKEISQRPENVYFGVLQQLRERNCDADTAWRLVIGFDAECRRDRTKIFYDLIEPVLNGTALIPEIIDSFAYFVPPSKYRTHERFIDMRGQVTLMYRLGWPQDILSALVKEIQSEMVPLKDWVTKLDFEEYKHDAEIILFEWAPRLFEIWTEGPTPMKDLSVERKCDEFLDETGKKDIQLKLRYLNHRRGGMPLGFEREFGLLKARGMRPLEAWGFLWAAYFEYNEMSQEERPESFYERLDDEIWREMPVWLYMDIQRDLILEGVDPRLKRVLLKLFKRGFHQAYLEDYAAELCDRALLNESFEVMKNPVYLMKGAEAARTAALLDAELGNVDVLKWLQDYAPRLDMFWPDFHAVPDEDVEQSQTAAAGAESADGLLDHELDPSNDQSADAAEIDVQSKIMEEFQRLAEKGFGAIELWRLYNSLLSELGTQEEVLEDGRLAMLGSGGPDSRIYKDWCEQRYKEVFSDTAAVLRPTLKTLWVKGFDEAMLNSTLDELLEEDPLVAEDHGEWADRLQQRLENASVVEWLFERTPQLKEIYPGLANGHVTPRRRKAASNADGLSAANLSRSPRSPKSPKSPKAGPRATPRASPSPHYYPGLTSPIFEPPDPYDPLSPTNGTTGLPGRLQREQYRSPTPEEHFARERIHTRVVADLPPVNEDSMVQELQALKNLGYGVRDSWLVWLETGREYHDLAEQIEKIHSLRDDPAGLRAYLDGKAAIAFGKWEDDGLREMARWLWWTKGYDKTYLHRYVDIADEENNGRKENSKELAHILDWDLKNWNASEWLFQYRPRLREVWSEEEIDAGLQLSEEEDTEAEDAAILAGEVLAAAAEMPPEPAYDERFNVAQRNAVLAIAPPALWRTLRRAGYGPCDAWSLVSSAYYPSVRIGEDLEAAHERLASAREDPLLWSANVNDWADDFIDELAERDTADVVEVVQWYMRERNLDGYFLEWLRRDLETNENWVDADAFEELLETETPNEWTLRWVPELRELFEGDDDSDDGGDDDNEDSDDQPPTPKRKRDDPESSSSSSDEEDDDYYRPSPKRFHPSADIDPDSHPSTPATPLGPSTSYETFFTHNRPSISTTSRSTFIDFRAKKVDNLRYKNRLWMPRRLPNTPTKSHLPPSPRRKGPKPRKCEACGRAFRVRKAGKGRSVTPRRSTRSVERPVRY